jgi:hypothetical protein
MPSNSANRVTGKHFGAVIPPAGQDGEQGDESRVSRLRAVSLSTLSEMFVDTLAEKRSQEMRVVVIGISEGETASEPILPGFWRRERRKPLTDRGRLYINDEEFVAKHWIIHS